MCGAPLYFTGKCGIINCYCYTLGCGKGERKARLAAFYIIYNNVRRLPMLNRFKAQLHRHRTALGGLAVLLISLFVLMACRW